MITSIKVIDAIELYALIFLGMVLIYYGIKMLNGWIKFVWQEDWDD